jgi:hypothetical protein
VEQYRNKLFKWTLTKADEEKLRISETRICENSVWISG